MALREGMAATGGGSILDGKETHFLGFPLTLMQQICVLFLFPAIFQAVIYVVDLSTDIAIGSELLQEGKWLAGGVTIGLIFVPALGLLAVRLSRPPKKLSEIPAWFGREVFDAIAAPVKPLFSFGERIFYSVEALRHSDPQRERDLLDYESTRKRTIETYMFLQGFFQAGPQAILQLSLLILGESCWPETEEMQVLCLLSSVCSLSVVAANFHRYESQAQGGRSRVLGNAARPPANSDDIDGDLLMRAAMGGSIRLPTRSRWTKAMTQDVPAGKVLLFFFSFLFLLGRLLSLGLAAKFFPVVVVGVVFIHYLVFFLYILPSPKFTASLPTKLLLPFVFVFCLVEVGIQFAKPGILYTLFYLLTVTENIALTIVWIMWGDWKQESFWFKYCLYVIGICHLLSLFLLIIYIRFYRPKVKRMRPQSQEVSPEERPLSLNAGV